jgi:hypothetical protein
MYLHKAGAMCICIPICQYNRNKVSVQQEQWVSTAGADVGTEGTRLQYSRNKMSGQLAQDVSTAGIICQYSKKNMLIHQEHYVLYSRNNI